MGSYPKALRGRMPREQVVLGACPNCGTARVVMPCSDPRCDAWFSVCECNDAIETSYSCGGRCESCRALDSEERPPREPPTWHPARNSRGEFRTPYAPHLTRGRAASASHRGHGRRTKGGA